MLLADVSRQLEELTQLLLVGAHVHRGTGEHIRGSDQHRITYTVHELLHILHRGQRAPFGLVHADTVEHGGELVAVLGVVDTLGRSTQDGHLLRVEFHRQIVGDLSAGGDDDAVRVLQLDDIHHPFEGQFIEIESVADIVVGRNGFGVVVDHHGTEAVGADGVQGLYAAPVELDGRTDTVGAGAEDDDGFLVAEVVDVVLDAAVGKVEVIGLCGELAGQCVYLFDDRQYAQPFAVLAHLQNRLIHGHGSTQTHGTCHLEIGEAQLLGAQEQFAIQLLYAREVLEFRVNADDMLQALQEPAVNLGKFVDTLHAIALIHSLCDGEDALVGRCFQGRVQVIDMQVFVLGETVHALTYHTQAFLDSLFERAADSHHLAHGFHGTAQFAVDAAELAQIPAGNLTNHVIQRGLEEGGGRFGDRVVQFEQPVPQAEFGCHKRQRIARGFGCEGR